MSDFREEEKLGKLYDTRLTHRLMKYLRQTIAHGNRHPVGVE